MAFKGIVLQDSFLNQIRREQAQVTVHLTNGYQFRGLVKAFDNFVILLEVDRKQIMIYKHAISTVSPAKFINISADPVSEIADS